MDAPPPPGGGDPPGDGRSLSGAKAQAAPRVVYQYDFQGRRVAKFAPGEARLYFWDVAGEVVWEFPAEPPEADKPNKESALRIFLNGRLVTESRPDSGAHTFYPDHLGTPRLKADPLLPQAVFAESYYPFGQQAGFPDPLDAHARRFTGKERDPETGLDYFGARYGDSVQGRFISVDPTMDSVNPQDPQTWNRYAYGRNNPLFFRDSDGRIVETIWDVANIGIGLASFFSNLQEGNFGSAALDFGGVVVDTAAAVVPGLPGGAGTAIKLKRAADALDAAVDVSKAGRGGRRTQQAGNALEEAASEITGIPINRGPGRGVVPGSGPGGFRVPDLKAFGELGSIKLRGSIIEVKDVKRLEGRKQIRDLIKVAKLRGLKVEIFVRKGTKIPQGGPIGRAREEKILKIIEIE
ncbi:MAG: RHS repeat-associated core domain-containing protein [Acidobacteriota bacterium]